MDLVIEVELSLVAEPAAAPAAERWMIGHKGRDAPLIRHGTLPRAQVAVTQNTLPVCCSQAAGTSLVFGMTVRTGISLMQHLPLVVDTNERWTLDRRRWGLIGSEFLCAAVATNTGAVHRGAGPVVLVHDLLAAAPRFDMALIAAQVLVA